MSQVKMAEPEHTPREALISAIDFALRVSSRLENLSPDDREDTANQLATLIVDRLDEYLASKANGPYR